VHLATHYDLDKDLTFEVKVKDLQLVLRKSLSSRPWLTSHKRSFERYHPDPLQPFLPQDWGFATPPKTTIAIISLTGEATDFKFGRYIHRVHPNKIPLNFFGENGGRTYPGTAQIFGVPRIILGTGKAKNFKCCTHIYGIIKNLGKSSRGRSKGLPKISGHSYIGRIARSYLR